MPLLIIAEKEIERNLLQEAFQEAPIDVEVYRCLTDAQEGREDCFALVVASQGNLKEVKQWGEQIPVFLIANEAPKDDSAFQKVLMRPVRLGAVVDVVMRFMQEQRSRALLSPVKLGTVTLNPKSAHISCGGEVVRLTEKELAILMFLSKNKDAPVSKQKLLDEVWGYAGGIETHTLETHIYRLRQKLQTHLALKDFLITREEGYVLNF